MDVENRNIPRDIPRLDETLPSVRLFVYSNGGKSSFRVIGLKPLKISYTEILVNNKASNNTETNDERDDADCGTGVGNGEIHGFPVLYYFSAVRPSFSIPHKDNQINVHNTNESLRRSFHICHIL